MSYDLAQELQRARELTTELSTTLEKLSTLIPTTSNKTNNNQRKGNPAELRKCFTDIPRIDQTYNHTVDIMDSQAAAARRILANRAKLGTSSADAELLEKMESGVKSYDRDIKEIKENWEKTFKKMESIDNSIVYL